MNKREIGDRGEELAAAFLRKKGYRVLERNFVCRFGEADIIAEDGEFLVFVEVKLRKDRTFGEAREYVTLSKQKKIIRAAQYYLMKTDGEKQLRFDVVEVYPDPGKAGGAEILHIADAFQ